MRNLTAPNRSNVILPNGIKISHTALGPSAGKVVIFLQGSGPGASGWTNFRYNAKAFARGGYRVLIPDLPGFGDSAKPVDQDYSLAFFVQCISQYADAVQAAQFAMVGNSLGGAVSIGLALEQPERVTSLILMGCGGLEDQITYFQTMEGIQAMTRVPLDSAEFTPAYLKEVLKLIVFDPKHITDELIEERFRVLSTQPASVFKRMTVPNLSGELHNIKCPVLSFWGAGDKFCPLSGAEKLAVNCKTAEVILLSQCGHWLMIEYADLFNQRCLAFLE